MWILKNMSVIGFVECSEVIAFVRVCMCCSMLSKLASMYVKALDVDRAIFKQYREVFRSVDFSLVICEGGSFELHDIGFI